jgi:hypothetical protein
MRRRIARTVYDIKWLTRICQGNNQ